MNIISSSTSFVISPIADLINTTRAKQICENNNRVARQGFDIVKKRIIEGIDLFKTYSFGEALPIDKETKIKAIIKKLGYDTSNIFLRLDDKKTSHGDFGAMAVTGSIKEWGICILFFSTKMIEEMDKGISDVHEFIIAHELAHNDLNDDYFVEKLHSTSKYKLIAYGITLFATNYFLPGFGYLVNHLASLGISKFVGRVKEISLSRSNEKGADLHALKKNPHLAKGAIRLFQQLKKYNLKLKKSSNSNDVNDEGENLSDVMHPKLAERIEYISQLYKPSKS